MPQRRAVLVYGASLFAAAALPSAVFAQRRDDEGQFQIQQALYGYAGRNIDVTDRLKRIARRDRMVRITNDLFGADPFPGQVKTLRIYARGRGNRVRVFEYREGDVIDGAQFSGWSGGGWGSGRRGGWDGPVGEGRGPRGGITVLSASYGDGRRMRDVTQRVREMERGGRLDFEVRNELFGFDPAPGRGKSLVIVYSSGGNQQEVRVPERGRVVLP